jgi:hypothetical protein
MLIDDELALDTPIPPPVFLVSGGVGSSGRQLLFLFRLQVVW